MNSGDALEAFLRRPCDQFTLSDLEAHVAHCMDSLLATSSLDTRDVRLLETLVGAICSAAHRDRVLASTATGDIVRMLMSSVHRVQWCAENDGLNAAHMERALSDILAVLSRFELLRHECERLAEELHRPDRPVFRRLHAASVQHLFSAGCVRILSGEIV